MFWRQSFGTVVSPVQHWPTIAGMSFSWMWELLKGWGGGGGGGGSCLHCELLLAGCRLQDLIFCFYLSVIKIDPTPPPQKRLRQKYWGHFNSSSILLVNHVYRYIVCSCVCSFRDTQSILACVLSEIHSLFLCVFFQRYIVCSCVCSFRDT